MSRPITLANATSAEDFETARELFREYAASLTIDLCFQGFSTELASLPAMYGPPGGCLILAKHDEAVVACVGVRRFSDSECELKRLFVRESARGGGLGRTLTHAAIRAARELGYSRMLLDTLDEMVAARGLYASLGFTAIPAFYPNPSPGVHFMALDLRAVQTAG
jgi:GNAT superfamily N-acetyltransferase